MEWQDGFFHNNHNGSATVASVLVSNAWANVDVGFHGLPALTDVVEGWDDGSGRYARAHVNLIRSGDCERRAKSAAGGG